MRRVLSDSWIPPQKSLRQESSAYEAVLWEDSIPNGVNYAGHSLIVETPIECNSELDTATRFGELLGEATTKILYSGPYARSVNKDNAVF